MDPNDDSCPAEHWLIPHIRAVQAETAQARSRAKEADDGPSIAIFDPAEVRRKLPSCRGFEMGDNDFEVGNAGRPPASDALAEWQTKLNEILDDRRGARRRLVVADDQLLDRLTAVKKQCPGFEIVSDLVIRTASLSAKTQSPLKLPAMLLVGPAGVGKTHFARKLAAGLQVPLEFVCGDLLSDRGTLTGLSPAWRAAKTGRIAAVLLESLVASPLFIVDEVDKVSAIHQHENPLAFLHSVLEPENAKRFTDEYLCFPIRADHAFWILTANSATALSPSILDRLVILPINPPDQAAMMVIVRNIYRDANVCCSNWFDPNPNADVVAALARHNPRRVTKLVDFALGFAAKDGRNFLNIKDIESSLSFMDLHEGKEKRIGFLTG